MTETTNHEQVVMTPKCKTANSTVLLIERKINTEYIGNGKVHVAGGAHTGIVINKEISAENGEALPAKLSLEFCVFLVSAQTGKHTQESRILRYWFRTGDKSLLNNTEEATIAQEFFRELVSPQEFPRDYVGFIKKIMKLMQHKYDTISKLEVELRQLEETIVPSRPPRPGYLHVLLGPHMSRSGLTGSICGTVFIITHSRQILITAWHGIVMKF